MLKKIFAYITRSWDDEGYQPHPRLEILPPFAFDLLTWSVWLAIGYGIIKTLIEKFF